MEAFQQIPEPGGDRVDEEWSAAGDVQRAWSEA